MQAVLADGVYAVFNRGIALRDRLEAGDSVDWEREQQHLHRLLSAFANDAGALSGDDFGFVFSEQGSKEERRRLTRATIGFALTCWLDEWLTFYAPPDARLPEKFGGADSGAKFWDESRYAETRGDLDALEAMHLCVMLGFRGNWRSQPAQVEAWAARIRAKLEPAAQTWTTPASLEVPRFDRTRLDDRPLRRMAFSLLLTFSLLLPLALAVLWRL